MHLLRLPQLTVPLARPLPMESLEAVAALFPAVGRRYEELSRAEAFPRFRVRGEVFSHSRTGVES